MNPSNSIPPVVPPIIRTESSAGAATRTRSTRGLAVVLAVAGVALVLCAANWVVGAVNVFRLSPETSALVRSAKPTGSDPWRKRVGLNLGGLTFGAVRLATRFVELPPEARLALGSIRAAEVAVYELEPGRETARPDRGEVLARADAAMARRGWERVVGVVKGEEVVGVYLPTRGLSEKKVTLRLLVCTGKELVVVGSRLNLEELTAGDGLLTRIRAASQSPGGFGS